MDPSEGQPRQLPDENQLTSDEHNLRASSDNEGLYEGAAVHGYPDQPADATPPGPGVKRLRQVRAFTWVLLALLALTAVLGSQLRPEPQLMHVAGTSPAIEAPTGQLLTVFDKARDATVRLEARCIGAGSQVLGVGTGFFVSEDGLLLTAYHVVTAETTAPCRARLVAVTTERQEYNLELVGFDAYMDLAALKADVRSPVPFIPLAARLPSPGTGVVAIGNSRDDFMGARAGRVTRLGVQAGRADFASDTIELTNSLAPGDSGGPVINARGEAVGVVSYISFNPNAMSSQSYVPPFLQGLSLARDFAGYAVPVTQRSDLVDAVLAGQRRDVPVVGFRWRDGLDYDPAKSPHYLGSRPGPIVDSVAPGGPADLAGLKGLQQETVVNEDGTVTLEPVADVIVAVNGTPTPTFYDLLALIRSQNIGDVVTLTVQRGNATFRLEMKLAASTAIFAGS